MALCHITMPLRSAGLIRESDWGCSVQGAWYTWSFDGLRECFVLIIKRYNSG